MKTYQEINEKIKNGTAVVVTAEEIIDIVDELGEEKALDYVDVVTCATFGPMCSSGAFLNFGHAEPAIRMQKILLNNIPCSGGLAAVDTYIGATEESLDREYQYGGAHLICDLIEGKDIHLVAESRGTDCYPRTHIDTYINKDSINEMYLYNPRNAYQNYAVAVNGSDKEIYTYMGKLLPHYQNATYSNAGVLSPLLNDPFFKHIGVGTKIFLCGTQGFVAWQGTQFHSQKERNEKGIPTTPAGTLAVIGDLREMDTQFIKPVVFQNYGVSICIGIGVPIPITDLETLRSVCIRDEDIETTIVDYSSPKKDKPTLGKVTYKELRSGSISIDGLEIKTQPISSLQKAREIAETLKKWIQEGSFTLQEKIASFPDKSLNHKL